MLMCPIHLHEQTNTPPRCANALIQTKERMRRVARESTEDQGEERVKEGAEGSRKEVLNSCNEACDDALDGQEATMT